ncbi:MAG: hypothetical protein RIC55_29390 [Pirellulaceae bacterium]
MRHSAVALALAAALLLLLVSSGDVYASAPDAESAAKTNSDTNSDTDPDAKPALLPDGSLPWKRRESEIQPEQIAKSARDTLAGFGIGPAEFALFDDGQPFSTTELDVMLRIVYRLPHLSTDDLARWARKDVDWPALEDAPAEHRGDVYRLQGRARQIVKMTLPEEKAEIFDLPQLWRVSVEVEGAPGPLEIISREIPRAWLGAREIDQPFSAFGLFLKRAPATEQEQSDGEPGPLTFVANRMGWHPDQPDEKLGVQPVHVFLSQKGLDLSEFDSLIDRSKALPPEPFYQLLAAVGQADEAELEKYSEPFSLVDLLQDPKSQRGRVIDLTGHAQQMTKILVDNPDARRRYGIDYYYEIDMFVKLPGEVKLVDPNDPSKALWYKQYPVTVCVRELPEGLSEPSKPSTYQTINRDITVPAVFFKVWAVSTARVRQVDNDRMQFNPLFIGGRPQLLEYEQLTGPWLGIGVAAAFAVALIAVWVGVWRSQKGDQRVDQQTIRKQFEVQPGQSLDEQGIEASDGPDFSGLEAMDKSPSRED